LLLILYTAQFHPLYQGSPDLFSHTNDSFQAILI
jgi:hypothetical protein